MGMEESSLKKEPWRLRRLKKKIRGLEIDLHYSQNMLEKVSDVMTDVIYKTKGLDFGKHYEAMYHLWLYRVRNQEKRLKKLRDKRTKILLGKAYG